MEEFEIWGDRAGSSGWLRRGVGGLAMHGGCLGGLHSHDWPSVRQHLCGKRSWMQYGLVFVLLVLGPCTSSLMAQEDVAVADAVSEVKAVAATVEAAQPPPRVLRVGTKQSPPFAIKHADGSWSGISIELWKQLTDELNLEYEFEELTLDQMLVGLESRELDAAVAAISVTSDRHDRVGFCHPHFSTGLGIAVNARDQTTAWTLIRRVVSSRLIKIMVTMICIVFVCGLLFWQFERKRNTAMFGGKRRQGIWMGVWWSTTLLLGNKGVAPVSAMGRILAASAMMSSIMVLSILTGVITSVLTVQQLDTGIARATDLHDVRVATVASSTSADYLRQRRIFFRGYATPREAIEAVVKGEADAVVYDAALLKYLATEEFSNRIDVLPVSFNVQEYAIALQLNSQLRKPLNTELLRYRESDAWDQLVYRYLGE